MKKAPAKSKTAKKAAPKAVKSLKKPAAVPHKVKESEVLRSPKGEVERAWGRGPWAVEAPPRPREFRIPATPPRPALEDVFNHKVKTSYGVLQQLRTPRGVWMVRAVLITLAVLVWLALLLGAVNK